MNFKQCNLGPAVRLHLCETDKFKSLTCKIFIQQDLEVKAATSAALIPLLLRRGSSQFPSTVQIAKELEYLYAAEFSADILKIGERQILEFHFQMVDPRLLPRGEQQLKRGLNTFWDIVSRPAGVDQAFQESFFAQEKQTLRQELEGLVNEKPAYALARFIALMCADEPFGVYKYGEAAELEQLQNRQVFAHYRELLNKHPLDIFLVGSSLDVAANYLAQLLAGHGQNGPLRRSTPVFVKTPRFFEENLDLQQAILVLGYRTNCTYLDEDYYALLVGNGILGGFPHSKLFMNVREQASLAYYVSSGIEGCKGLLTINAGINGEKLEQTQKIIKEQVQLVQEGNFSAAELEQTKRGLISAIAGMNDSPTGLIDRNLIGVVQGQMRTVDTVTEAISAVEARDVARAMGAITLDTTYTLRAPGQKGAGHGTN